MIIELLQSMATAAAYKAEKVAGFALGMEEYAQLKLELSGIQRISEEEDKGLTTIIIFNLPVYTRAGKGIDVLWL